MPPRSEKELRTFINEFFGNGFGNKSLGRDGIPRNLRYDVPIPPTAHFSTIDDVEMQHDDLPKAACCLIRRKDGKVLAVSRGNDLTQWGMPGGHVEQGEDVEDGAARELWEETGIIADKMTPLFVGVEKNGGFEVTTFSCTGHGKMRSSEEGQVRWVDPKVLINGPFGEYARKLFDQLGALEQ